VKRLLQWLLGGRGSEAIDDVVDLFRRRAARVGPGPARLRLALDVISLVNLAIQQRSRLMIVSIPRVAHGLLTGISGDLRYATRVLCKSPSFSSAAILILALGIGATTAVFTVVNAILLVPTAAENTGAVGIYSRNIAKPGTYRLFSYLDYQQIRSGGAPFADIMAYTFTRPGVTVEGQTRLTNAVVATSNYFSLFDTRLALGREFTADEERPGSDIRVVIVAHAYWQRAGGTPAILGSTVRLNNLDYTIIGVAPKGFAGTLSVLSPEFWLPTGVFERLVDDIVRENREERLADPTTRRLMLVGRLPRGSTPDEAAPLVDSLSARLAEQDPTANRDHVLTIQRLSRVNISSRPASDGPLAAISALVMGMASLVLLLACLNLANMLLARATSRRREIAVRVAVGAGRLRIVRQLLLESLLLALVGGIVGLLLAYYATHVLMTSASTLLPFLLVFDGRPDWRVFVVTVVFCVISTLSAGLGPAWHASRPDLLASLKDHTSLVVIGRRRFSIRNALVVTQLAVCLALLVSAGLFVRGARLAADANPGFATDRGILLQVDPSLAGYDELTSRATIIRVMESLRAMPGVESASLGSIVPFGDERDGRGILRAADSPDSEPFGATFTVIGAQYFETLAVPILQGREFSTVEESSAAGMRSVVIDQPLAAVLFGDEPPIGQMIRFAGDDDPTHMMQVIGVVAGVRNSVTDARPGAHVYVPFGQTFASGQYLHVRVRPGADPAAFLNAARQTMRRVDPNLPILKIKTLEQFLRDGLPLWVLATAGRLFSTFGVVALILAVVGVYGMRAYVVSRRTHEIAVRLALGATPRGVLWMLVGEGIALTTVGLLIGVAVAWSVGRLLSVMLFGVSSTDPLVFTSAIVILASAALVASYVPVRRVTMLAPTEVLRSE
jgi:predicted permease